MSKAYKLDLEQRSAFLSPVEAQGEKEKQAERDDTSPLRGARLINIERIVPDPNQPRKTFDQGTLESLAESIKEVGGIIDPLTVTYDEKENIFRIVSGERRYRAAKLAGLGKLPCIIKEGDQEKTLLLQLISNLQREDMKPLEESAAIRSLKERFGYSQAFIATMSNKSTSYISQILGLEKLAQPAREILQTSEVHKEVQIQASKEKDPEKQLEVLRKASEEGKTVKQIRLDTKMRLLKEAEKPCCPTSAEEKAAEITVKTFRKWTWRPADGRFSVTIQFSKEQNEAVEIQLAIAALEETLKHLRGATPGNGR
jgi:ParB family transcriptional regulator, chromosome partitioning protein